VTAAAAHSSEKL